MRIFVYSPDYNHKSGGITVLHYFMFLLRMAHHDVVTCARVFNPAWPAGAEYAARPSRNEDMIVAPEITWLDRDYDLGLPILRWVLYYPGKNENGGPIKYDYTEIVYHWDDCYAESAAKASFNGESKLFNLPNLSREDYADTPPAQRRGGSLFFVYKGRNMRAHPAGSLEITPSFPAERKDLLRLFRERADLYCYDPHTVLMTEAALCGMKVHEWDYGSGAWKDFIVPGTRFRDHAADTAAVSRLLDDFAARKARITFESNRKYRVNYLPRAVQRLSAKIRNLPGSVLRRIERLSRKTPALK